MTEYYAAPGRVVLTDANLLHVTPKFDDPAANRSIKQLIGNFIALRMTYPSTGRLSTNWQMDNFRVYAHTPFLPVLTPHLRNGQIDVAITGATKGFHYLLQRSGDLVQWDPILNYVSDGNDRTYSEAASGQAFYRVALP